MYHRAWLIFFFFKYPFSMFTLAWLGHLDSMVSWSPFSLHVCDLAGSPDAAWMHPGLWGTLVYPVLQGRQVEDLGQSTALGRV